MAPSLSLPLPLRRAVALAGLAWLCAEPALATMAMEVEAGVGVCPGAGGACAEEQVERAEEQLAFTMRTELLQQDARRFRAGAAVEKLADQAVFSEALPAKTEELAPTKPHLAQLESHTEASSPFNDTEIRQLTHEEQNLTSHVNQQAATVAKRSEELSRALVGARASAQHGAELERKLTEARSEADASEQRIESFILALGKLREREDELKNETALAEQRLNNLTRQYLNVKNDYKELLGRFPTEQGANTSAAAAVRSAGEEVHEAAKEAGSAQAVVRADSLELQEAIQKLNALNAELKVIEGRIRYRYEHSAAAASSWSPLLLLLALFAIAGSMH